MNSVQNVPSDVKYLMSSCVVPESTLNLSGVPNELNPEEVNDTYHLHDELGEGSFGKVLSATRISDQAAVALKVADKKHIFNWKILEHGQRVPMEIYLLQRVRSVNNVAKLLAYYVLKNMYVMVFEKPTFPMSLWSFIRQHSKLDEYLARKFMGQLTVAMIECQLHGVTHNDLKTENVVVNMIDNTLKVVDFGAGTIYVRNLVYRQHYGTKVDLPLEYVRDGWYYPDSATVWSLGVILFDMVNGRRPFASNQEILKGIYEVEFDKNVSNPCKHLIQRCLAPDYCSRPTFSEILKDPWMAQNTW